MYDGLLARRPEHAAVWVGRAILLHELGRRDDALASFERATDASGHAPEYEARLVAYRALLAGNAQ